MAIELSESEMCKSEELAVRSDIEYDSFGALMTCRVDCAADVGV